MADRRSVILYLAVLLSLALLVPAVAAAEGHGAGERGAGGISVGSGSGDAGETGTGTHAPAAGGSSAASRREAGAVFAPTDARATVGVQAAAVQQKIEASIAVEDRSAYAGGRGYRGGLDLLDSAAESSASGGGPRPEVTRTPGREYAPQSGTAPPRTVRASHGGSGIDRDGESAAGNHGEGGRHGPPATANPVPYAAPTRSADEQKTPAPGTPGASAGRTRKDSARLPAPMMDPVETPDPILLLRFLLVLGFRRIRPGNVLEHPLRRTLHGAIAADPGLDLAGCAAATGANRETLRYHLALLICYGKVAEETRNGSVRYFPPDPALTPVRRAVLHAQRNRSLEPILSAIQNAPGISRHELAEHLGVAGPSVTRQVQRLIEDLLVESERCGRSTCYRLTADCVAALGPSLAAVPEAPASESAAV